MRDREAGAAIEMLVWNSLVAMPTGVKGEIMMFIGDAEGKLGRLAEAMPESKYTWRPADGARSPADVFIHVAAANFGIPGFWGVRPPAGFDFNTYEKSLTKKAKE